MSIPRAFLHYHEGKNLTIQNSFRIDIYFKQIERCEEKTHAAHTHTHNGIFGCACIGNSVFTRRHFEAKKRTNRKRQIDDNIDAVALHSNDIQVSKDILSETSENR